MADVPAFRPDGTPVFVPSEQVEDALSQGYKLEEGAPPPNPLAEYDSPTLAGIAGAARGATLGLSDYLATETGLIKPQTLRGLQLENPVASGVGEAAGTIAPAVFSGGAALPAGAAARLGTSISTKLGGKMAARVVAGAVEGGLYGTGQAISEEALGDPDVNAERLISSVGMGALLGAGGNLAGYGLERGVAKLLGRGASRAAGEAAERVAGTGDDAARVGKESAEAAGEGAAQGARTAPADDVYERLRNVTDDVPTDEELGAVARKNAPFVKKVLTGLGLDFPTPEGFVLRDLDLTGAQVGKVKAKGKGISAPKALLDDARYADAVTLPEKLSLIGTKRVEAGQAIADSVAAFDDVAAAAADRVDPVKVAEQIKKQVLAPLGKGLIDDGGTRNRVQGILDKLEEIAADNIEVPVGPGVVRRRPVGSIPFSKAEELKQSIDPYIKWDSLEPGPTQAALRKVRGILNGEIERKAEAVARKANLPEAFEGWKRAKGLYGDMAELEAKVATRAGAREGNRFFSLTDNMAGGAAVAAGGLLNPAGAAMGLGAAVLNKWGRERLPHVMALYFHRLRSSRGAQVASKGFHKRISKMLESGVVGAATPDVPQMGALPFGSAAPGAASAAVGAAAPTFGKYGAVLANAAANGAEALWVTHAALSDADPEYQQELSRAGFQTETPDQRTDLLRRGDGLAAMQDALEAQDARLEAAVGRFFGKQGGRAPTRNKGPMGRDARLADYEGRAKALMQFAGDPAALAEALRPPESLVGAAPGLALATTAAATRAAQFLSEKVPQHPNPNPIPALERPWKPSNTDLARWQRYVQAVDDPASVLEDMKQGKVAKESVEALRAVYPRYLEEIQQRVAERLSAMSGRLPSAQRTALATLFGEGFDARRKARQQVIQQAHRAAAQAEAQKAQAAQSSAQGAPPARPIRMNDFASYSQRMEARGAN